MKIQSLSVVVPNKSCINNCRPCVSRMHCDTYKNQMDDNLPFFDLYLKDYMKRLEFARDNGCNTVMLTGSSEPQQNRKFLTYFGMMMQMMENPFRWIEMQTTGVTIDRNYLRFLRNHVGLNLISLSLFSFDDRTNSDAIRHPSTVHLNLTSLCDHIKEYDFALRLSLNMTDEFRKYLDEPMELFRACRYFGADQVTLRYLYSDGEESDQRKYIEKHGMSIEEVRHIEDYVKSHGRPLGVLPHGAEKYSIGGICVVVDTDCMDKAEKRDENYKYLILRPDCKLYSQWDDPASLIF